MCRRVECRSCNKPSFAGCGMHIEQVLGDVPHADRCRCNERGAAKKDASVSDPQAKADGSFWKRLIG